MIKTLKNQGKRNEFLVFTLILSKSKLKRVNLELFIARRLLKGSGENTVSVPIVKIALVGIALGVCVMLLSIFIITGFKQEITSKLTGFSAHLNVVSYGARNSYTNEGVRVTDTLFQALENTAGIKNVYRYITKPAILKSEGEIHGVVLYGVDSSYDAAFFRDNLKAGSFPDFHTAKASDEILLSATVARFLGVKTGDKIQAHFVQEPPRVRVWKIKGIYDTGFKEYDEVFAICDSRHLQRLNAWEADKVSGVALELKDIKSLTTVAEEVEKMLPWGAGEEFYRVNTLYETAPQIFDWLELLNMNIWIIIILIVMVAGFNMVSGLLILILDKTSLIGILKALGYKNVSLRKLFLYISFGLIGRGVLWGNILAFGLAWLQYEFKLIHLDASAYYMDTVPVNFDIFYALLLDAGVLLVSTAMLVVPTMLISRIHPIRAIRFE